MTVIMRAKTVS